MMKLYIKIYVNYVQLLATYAWMLVRLYFFVINYKPIDTEYTDCRLVYPLPIDYRSNCSDRESSGSSWICEIGREDIMALG